MTTEYSLASVVAEICERAGLPFGRYDVTKLDAFVEGLQITNKEDAFKHLQLLAETYLFDPCSHDGVLDFVHRGGEPVMTINPDHVISDSNDTATRRSGQKLPKVLNLNYFDSIGGIDTDKQTSDRSGDARGEGEVNIDSPLVLNTEFAAELVAVRHKILIEEFKGDIKLKLPETYIELTVGDIVIYNNDRLRVDEVSIDDGEQEYTLIYDRKSAYQAKAFGLPPAAPSVPVLIDPGVTTIEFIDCHTLVSGDDQQLGFYVAIAGASPAWRGARVELSIDGGQTYVMSRTSSVSAIIGELAEVVPAARVEVPDNTSTITVQLTTYGAQLEDRSFSDLLNRQNRAIIGDEIINFENADEVSPGVWELTGLLRGRLGTAAGTHAVGERFVLLQRNYIDYVATDLFNLGQPLTFRATTLGSGDETIINQTFNGLSQTERAPSQLTARREGGSIYISWVGTGRIGGRGSVQMGQYFTGYRFYINGTPTDTTDNNVVVVDPGGSVTIAVHQINSLTGEGPAAEITL